MDINLLRSLRWADILVEALTNPARVFRSISSDRFPALYLTFLVPLVLSLTDMLSMSLLSQQTGYFFVKLSYGWILACLYLVVRLLLYTAAMDMTAQFMGLKGSSRELLVLVNVSLTPGLFLLPLVHVVKVLNAAPVFFYAVFALSLFTWSMVIQVRGMSDLYDIPASRAFAIAILPLLLVVLLVFFTLILGGVMVFQSLPGLNLSLPGM